MNQQSRSIYALCRLGFAPGIAPRIASALALPCLALGVSGALFSSSARGQLACVGPEQVVEVPGETDVLEGHYEFVNTGSFPVSLQSARFAKKGGRVILPGVRTVRPGQSALLEYRIPLDRKTGEFERTIRVKTDAARDNQQELVLKFTVPELVTVEPKILSWMPDEDHALPKVLTVVAGSDRPVKVLKAESLRGFFDVKVKPVKDGREYQVIVTPKTAGKIKAEYEVKWKKEEAERAKAGKKLPEGAMSPSHPSVALPSRLKEDRADRVVVYTDLPGKRAPRLSVLLVARTVEMTPRVLGPGEAGEQVGAEGGLKAAGKSGIKPAPSAVAPEKK